MHNGKPKQEWSSRKESEIPTASTEGTFLTTMIDAHEEQEAMASNTPNALTKASLKRENVE